MKIKINTKKIPSLFTDCSSIVEDFYYEKIDENIDTLIYELSNSVGNNYIVTGFRGSGKTTFIKFLEKKVSTKNSLFIFIDYPISKGYYTLLKKIIRTLYISLEKNQTIDKDIALRLKEDMSELYISTFNEVTGNISYNKERNTTKIIEKEYDALKVIIFCIAILLIILYFFIEEFNNPLMIYSSAILMTLSVSLKTIGNFFSHKFSSRKYKSENYKNDFSIKSYYDDDISEEHLKGIIKKFQNEGIFLTFIIDELDKIDDDKEINDIINSTKPLLLSGLANFIVISGQDTLYKIYNGRIQSDLVISSLFSREIHIPLFSDSYFQKIISIIFPGKSLSDKNLVFYISHLILISNKNIRKFIINLKKSIIQENGNSYIILEKNKIYENEHQILEVIEQIEVKQIQYHYPGVKDYLINELFIWINKIYLQGEHYFLIEDIIESERPDFICNYNKVIKNLGEIFFEELIKRKILIKKNKQYKLNIEVESNPNNTGVHSVEDIFIKHFRLFKIISEDIFNYYANEKTDKSVNGIDLKMIEFINEKFQLKLDSDILKIEKSLISGAKISEDGFVKLSSYVRDLPEFTRKILSNYNVDLLFSYFSRKGFSVDKEVKAQKKVYDFSFKKEKIIINIEVKFNSFEISSKLENINPNEYYIYLFYYDYNLHGYDKISNLKKLISNKSLSNNVFLVNNSESRWIVNPGTTKAYLDNILKKINKTKKSDPNSLFDNDRNIISGYKKIDDALRFSHQEVVTIASYPIEISNSILINIFIKNILAGKTGLYFYGNLAESKFVDDVIKKLNFDPYKFESGEIEDSEFEQLGIAMEELSKHCYGNIQKFSEIEDKLNILDDDIDFIFLENIQNIADSSKEYNELYKKLKTLAISYNVTIIVTSTIPYDKLSATLDKRGNIEMLNKYSPQILNLSNTILIAYKEDYWDEFSDRKGIIDIKIGKGFSENTFQHKNIQLFESSNGYIYETKNNK